MSPSPRRAAVVAAVLGLIAASALGASPATAAQSGTPGTNNDISDVTGLQVGQFTNEAAHTGTTVVYAPQTATAGIDVRGGSPITRETDVFKPTNEVQKTNAVMLTGGGEFGLAAGPGIMTFLAEKN